MKLSEIKTKQDLVNYCQSIWSPSFDDCAKEYAAHTAIMSAYCNDENGFRAYEPIPSDITDEQHEAVLSAIALL
jgi:hypothetical protein